MNLTVFFSVQEWYLRKITTSLLVLFNVFWFYSFLQSSYSVLFFVIYTMPSIFSRIIKNNTKNISQTFIKDSGRHLPSGLKYKVIKCPKKFAGRNWSILWTRRVCFIRKMISPNMYRRTRITRPLIRSIVLCLLFFKPLRIPWDFRVPLELKLTCSLEWPGKNFSIQYQADKRWE